MSEIIGTREAARRLRVHENTIRNWAHGGMLTDVRVPGTAQARYSAEQVDTLAAMRAKFRMGRWAVVAHLPRTKYRVIERRNGWDVQVYVDV